MGTGVGTMALIDAFITRVCGRLDIDVMNINVIFLYVAGSIHVTAVDGPNEHKCTVYTIALHSILYSCDGCRWA